MGVAQPAEAASGDLGARTPMPAGPALRASDADRERAAAILQTAAADGRISADELDERLELAYGAKSKDELVAIVTDLRPVPWPSGTPTPTKDAAVLSDFARKGHRQIGEAYRATAVITSGVLDLREAQFTGPETTVQVNSWISTVYVVVPDDAEVRVAGAAILGGFKQDHENAGYPGAHRINVTGVAVLGSVLVGRQLPPAKERRLQRRARKKLRNY